MKTAEALALLVASAGVYVAACAALGPVVSARRSGAARGVRDLSVSQALHAALPFRRRRRARARAARRATPRRIPISRAPRPRSWTRAVRAALGERASTSSTPRSTRSSIATHGVHSMVGVARPRAGARGLGVPAPRRRALPLLGVVDVLHLRRTGTCSARAAARCRALAAAHRGRGPAAARAALGGRREPRVLQGQRVGRLRGAGHGAGALAPRRASDGAAT